MIDRAAHPIQEASINLGPALLVVTFDAIFAFLALRFAKVPMIRDFGLLLAVGIAAICVCQHRPAAGDPRHPRVPVAHQGQGLQPRQRWPSWSCGSAACRPARRCRWRWPAWSSSPAASSSRTSSTIQSDPEEWVNQDTQVIQRHRHAQGRDRLVGRAGHLRRVRRRVQRRDRHVRHRVRQRAAGRRGPTSCSPPRRSSPPCRFLLEVPDTTAAAAHRGRRGAGLRGGAARHPGVAGQPRGRRAQPGVPHRSRLARAAGRLRRTRSATSSTSGDDRRRGRDPRGRRRDAVGPGRGGRGPAREHRVQPHPADLPGRRCSCSCSWRCGCAASCGRCCRWCRCSSPSGAASLVAWAFDLQLSPMTAVGGPLVVALCTEFTSLILLRFIEERQRGYSPREAMNVTAPPHRPGVHRLRPDGRLGRGGHRLLVAAVAARLRPDRGDERGGGAAVGVVFLPPMLVWAEERGWVTRGMRPHHDADRPTDARPAEPARRRAGRTPPGAGPAEHAPFPEARR